MCHHPLRSTKSDGWCVAELSICRRACVVSAAFFECQVDFLQESGSILALAQMLDDDEYDDDDDDGTPG